MLLLRRFSCPNLSRELQRFVRVEILTRLTSAMMFLQKAGWSMLSHAFAAWIVVDVMLFASNHDNVGSQGLLPEYDFIIGKKLVASAAAGSFHHCFAQTDKIDRQSHKVTYVWLHVI